MKTRLLLPILVFLLAACATSPTGRSQLILISPETAIVESQKAYINTIRELDAEGQLLRAPFLARRVGRITGRLVTVAERRFPHTTDWEWSVALIDAPEMVNAWCMAGGRMAVYSGLFKRLDLSDDEFAHIMGHEIAHALTDHTAERMSIALATNLGMAVLAAFSDNSNALTGAALAAKLALELPNSRVGEREADRMGMELASLAGYRPGAAVSLWEKMEQAGGSGGLEFLSTHPSPANRQETLRGLIPEMEELAPSGKVAVEKVMVLQRGAAEDL